MSFPPSLKRCRKNLEQSILARNSPSANFSLALPHFLPEACIFGSGQNCLPAISAGHASAGFRLNTLKNKVIIDNIHKPESAVFSQSQKTPATFSTTI
ncbi:hypothetical protein [Rhizobium sp. BK251]|uniref:hypothetical protein n=1 Tax=Rhizobium sp. BK251 TaxID=2512125 RepID=UPI00104F9041|nr:hypothetical protein [Rhizobium sp. BK251]